MVWSYVILFLPALLLLFYSILFVGFTGASSSYQQLSTVAINGYWMLLASLLIIFGCVLRDSRFFSASALLVLPISMFISLKSFLILVWFKTHRFPSHPTTSIIKYMSKCQRVHCDFVLQIHHFERFFIALFALHLFLYVSCMLMPRWLNRSLRVHRILVRKMFLFQFSFGEIDESFYRY